MRGAPHSLHQVVTSREAFDRDTLALVRKYLPLSSPHILHKRSTAGPQYPAYCHCIHLSMLRTHRGTHTYIPMRFRRNAHLNVLSTRLHKTAYILDDKHIHRPLLLISFEGAQNNLIGKRLLPKCA